MRIYYHLSQYISHRKAGQDYIRCLKSLGHDVILERANACLADIMIIHDDPLCFPDILPYLPKKYTVAYSVWENEILPEAYRNNLALVDEIWTCSKFCQASMLPHFSKVYVLPHLVSTPKITPEANTWATSRLQHLQGHFCFLSICDAINPRKNITALLSAFNIVQKKATKPVAMVIKQHRAPLDFSSIAGVENIVEPLTDMQVMALHNRCNAYVSAHHAEGWGLGLSESMSLGKPVIATGYSGNMEYMNTTNSLPVSYSMENVSAHMERTIPLFNTNMHWAAIDLVDLVNKMLQVVNPGVPLRMKERAAKIYEVFGEAAIMQRLAQLLGNIP